MTEMFCPSCEDSFYAFPGESKHEVCDTEGIPLDGDEDLTYDDDDQGGYSDDSYDYEEAGSRYL